MDNPSHAVIAFWAIGASLVVGMLVAGWPKSKTMKDVQQRIFPLIPIVLSWGMVLYFVAVAIEERYTPPNNDV